MHHTIDHNAEALEQLRVMKRLGVAHEKLIEMFGYSGLGRYEQMLEERDKGSKDPAAPASPDPRMIEGTAVEIKPGRDRW